jgi:thiamine biosynthesis lipoprotein
MRRVLETMGMVVSVEVPGAESRSVVEAVSAAFDWLDHVDRTFSPYRLDSAVSRYSDARTEWRDLPAEVRRVLRSCEDLRDETLGYFDIRRPGGGVDPSGFVKGWAVERASALLSRACVTAHCINAGGDVRTSGRPLADRPWHVAVVHPHDRTAVAAVISLDGPHRAVATSGTAERGAHVYDPHTGRAATALSSVTVVGPELTRADVYATAALAMGLRATDWLVGRDGYEAYVIDAGGYEWATPGLDPLRLRLAEQALE